MAGRTTGDVVAASEESDASSFNVCYLTVDGRPLTVIGSADAIQALGERLKEAPEVELHASLPQQPSDPREPPQRRQGGLPSQFT